MCNLAIWMRPKTAARRMIDDLRWCDTNGHRDTNPMYVFTSPEVVSRPDGSTFTRGVAAADERSSRWRP